MQILRAENHRRMPWKNGGGETTEIAVFPCDAGLGDFDWRVSMARVETDGPFSLFDGVDRTLAILKGAGMILSVGDSAPVRVTGESEPLPFAADLPTHAELIDGPISDLNVMTRRGRLWHRVARRVVAGSLEIARTGATVLLVVEAGQLSVTADGEAVEAGPLDALILEKTSARIEGRGRAYVIEIHGGTGP